MGESRSCAETVKILNTICGFVIIGMAILTFITTAGLGIFTIILNLYWITFGILIITAEFKIALILKYFAFLDGEYGKGFFLFFAGSWLIQGFDLTNITLLIQSITGITMMVCGVVTVALMAMGKKSG